MKITDKCTYLESSNKNLPGQYRYSIVWQSGTCMVPWVPD
jgi:hypothetical protein